MPHGILGLCHLGGAVALALLQEGLDTGCTVPTGGSMKHLPMILAVAIAAALAPAKGLGAQERGKDAAAIPKEHRPPPGMCRIWLNDVPAGQQPAPTDCATAVKNRPANGRVIFGDDYVDSGGKGEKKKTPPPFVKSFTRPPATPPRRP
jgi:hypothetical protein